MKKYLFFIATCVFFIVACTKDEPQSINNDEPQLKTSNSETGLKGVTNNGKWLVFSSEKDYLRIYESLEQQVESYDFDKSRFIETDRTFDYEPVLTEFESRLKHKSLRSYNLMKQYELYSRGMHPKEVMTSIQDYHIIDDVELAFLSKDGVVQIGRDIKMHRNGGTIITTSNKAIATQILEEGSIAALSIRNIEEVEIQQNSSGQGGGGDQAPECTADFVQFGETTQNGNNFQATFQWAQLLEAECVTDLELIWSWGDGTDNTTESIGSTSHTFTEEGTYNVCLQVSWNFEHDTNPEECNAGPTCQEITISDGNPCTEQILCAAATAIGAIPGLSGLVISDNNSTPGMLCANVEGIVSFLADFCADIGPDDITLTFNGEEGPCWETCDGPRDLVLSLGNACQTTLTVLFNEELDCQGGDHDSGWGWIDIDPGEVGLSIRQQTKSAANGGSNKVKAKMIRKENTWRGWARRREHIGLDMEKTVWATQTCGCDQSFNVAESDFPSWRKYTRSITEKDFPSSFDGLDLRLDNPDCWFANYYEGNNNPIYRGSGSGCDNY